MTNSAQQRPYVGGQAVIEGVMMRAPNSLAIAARRPDGSIVLRDDAWVSLWEKLKFLRWPFLRGSVVLIESLYNGIQALHFSASQTEEAQAEESEDAPEAGKGMATTIAFSFVLAFGLFVGLPHLLAWGTGELAGTPMGVETFWFHALDGFFKISIFVGYIGGISLIPEIRRVFEYHGAEHKVVNTYENEQELTVENARTFTTFHARCGTSFVLFVLVLSIFIFAAVFPLVPRFSDIEILNHLGLIVFKIPMMLPLAGLAYEINRYAANHPTQIWVQLLVLPGRWMQKLTTKEPDDAQLEIALAAMRAALAREAQVKAAQTTPSPVSPLEPQAAAQILVFENYQEVAAAIPASP